MRGGAWLLVTRAGSTRPVARARAQGVFAVKTERSGDSRGRCPCARGHRDAHRQCCRHATRLALALAPTHSSRRQQTLHIKENEEKIKLNKALPYLVANVVELLDAPEEVRTVRRHALC